MDKYEFNIKVEQMKKQANLGDFETAMKIADGIDWRRVQNVSLLSRVSEIYEKCGEYTEAKEILLLAFEKAPTGKGLLYRLCQLAVHENSIDEAEAYYREFYELAPEDPRQNILRYLILKARNAPQEQLIHTLEVYNHTELDERWMYELAELYHEAGRSDDCVRMCDSIMLMFGLGQYVDKAIELKTVREGVPLTSYQQSLINNRNQYEQRLKEVEEKYETGQIPEIPDVPEARAAQAAQAQAAAYQPETGYRTQTAAQAVPSAGTAQAAKPKSVIYKIGEDGRVIMPENEKAAQVRDSSFPDIRIQDPAVLVSREELDAAAHDARPLQDEMDAEIAAHLLLLESGGLRNGGADSFGAPAEASVGVDTAFESTGNGVPGRIHRPAAPEVYEASERAQTEERRAEEEALSLKEKAARARAEAERLEAALAAEEKAAEPVQEAEYPQEDYPAEAEVQQAAVIPLRSETPAVPRVSGVPEDEMDVTRVMPAIRKTAAPVQEISDAAAEQARQAAGQEAARQAAAQEAARQEAARQAAAQEAARQEAARQAAAQEAAAQEAARQEAVRQAAARQAAVQQAAAQEAARQEAARQAAARQAAAQQAAAQEAARQEEARQAAAQQAAAQQTAAQQAPAARAGRVAGICAFIEGKTPEEGLAKAVSELKEHYARTGAKHPVTKIRAERLNERGIVASADKIAGKDLIIEEAGDLSQENISELLDLAAADRTRSIMLVDNPLQLSRMKAAFPVLLRYFRSDGSAAKDPAIEHPYKAVQEQPASVVRKAEAPKAAPARTVKAEQPAERRPAARQEVFRQQSPDVERARTRPAPAPVPAPAPEEPRRQAAPQRQSAPAAARGEEELSIDDFAHYANDYAKKIDCVISGKSMLALYERVEIMDEDGIPLTRKNAEALIEEAADKAEKPPLVKRIGGLLSRKYDKNGMLILKEEDFIF